MSNPDFAILAGESGENWDVESSYAFCARMARSHYENFPVASLLLPKSVRRHVAAIYAFARPADDAADEGELSVDERLRRLDLWERALESATAGNGSGPVFTALGETLRTTNIPPRLLRDLLAAFRMDAAGGGFESEDDLLDYCRLSANPVGRLLLHLFGYADPDRVVLSDDICTGLQLVNFWQDISVDVPRDRINIPRRTMARFGYTMEELRGGVDSQNFRSLVSYLNGVAEEYLQRGAALPSSIPSLRLRLELRATVRGGLTMVSKVRELGGEVLQRRPRIGSFDLLRLAVATVMG